MQALEKPSNREEREGDLGAGVTEKEEGNLDAGSVPPVDVASENGKVVNLVEVSTIKSVEIQEFSSDRVVRVIFIFSHAPLCVCPPVLLVKDTRQRTE